MVKRTVERNAGDFAHTGKEAIRQCSLVCRNRLHPALGLDKVEAGRKAGDAVTVERARLKARGPLRGL